MGKHINETPKRHILGRKDVIWRTDRQNRSTGATRARDEETKKKEIQRKKPDSGKLGFHRDHPRRRIEINFAWWVVFGGSSKFRISSTPVKRFRSCGVSKFALSHWLDHWLIQQLVLPRWVCLYKPDSLIIDLEWRKRNTWNCVWIVLQYNVDFRTTVLMYSCMLEMLGMTCCLPITSASECTRVQPIDINSTRPGYTHAHLSVVSSIVLSIFAICLHNTCAAVDMTVSSTRTVGLLVFLDASYTILW